MLFIWIEVNSYLYKVVISMKITGIEEQKKNSKRCSIYIDGEYNFSIDKEILEELNFYVGMELNPDVFNQKLAIIDYKSALRTALYLLMRSSKTENELRKRLKEKQHSENTINAVLEYLKEIGYINDESYAESYIKSVRESAGTSKRSLYYKLAGKGVDSEVIRQKLEEAEIDDFAPAMKAAEKKAAGLKGDKRQKAAKLLNFLYRKGYGMEVCRKVIEELDLDETDI
jgi:regulatory protein